MQKTTLQIVPLLEKFGEEQTRAYLQDRFSKKENFFEFIGIFTEYAQFGSPDFHYKIFEALQNSKRGAAAAPRGGAKSTLVSFFYTMWQAVNSFSGNIVIISDTYSQAHGHVDAIKAEIEGNEILKWIYPGLSGEDSEDQWGQKGIVINGLKGKTKITPLGAGMKVRGLKFRHQRPDLIIVDDLENEDIVYSQERREKLKRWFDRALIPSLDPVTGRLYMIGTILHYHSLLKQIIDRQENYASWNTQLFRAISDDGQSFWPQRTPVEKLIAMRDNPQDSDYVGSVTFAQEYQNEPQDDKDRLIKKEWVKRYNFREKVLSFEGETYEEKRQKFMQPLEVIAGVDPAISEKETADFFAYYIMGFDEKTGNEYELDLIHDRIGNINIQVKVICDKIEEWKINRIGIESVAFQKGLATLVKEELQRRGVYYCRVIEIKTDKDKIRRAKIHSSGFEGGFIYLRSDLAATRVLEIQIEEFPLSEHDDALDALMLSRETRITKKHVRTFSKKPRGL